MHLSFFDNAVDTALTDPDRFRAERDETLRRPGSFIEAITTANRGRSGAEVLEWFTEARATMIQAFAHADQTMRVPWYGPDMSVASALTARIMETWAHGQDVFDGLGLAHPVTSALRQVAHIGVRTLPNSYVSNGLPVPAESVFVSLTAPDGTDWQWGDAAAANRVTAPAVDFCLVVTQRRHLADTAVATEGAVAAEWMSIALAFAGGAGAGRRPGQFPRSS